MLQNAVFLWWHTEKTFSFWGRCPQTPTRGFAPGPHWGPTAAPRPPHHFPPFSLSPSPMSESYHWFSSGYPARRLASYRDWLARCQYTLTGWGRKFDLQLLSQCGSVYICLSTSVPEIPYFYLSVAGCTLVWSDQFLRYPTSISVWQGVHLSDQISPWDTLLLSQCGSVYICLIRSVPEIPYFYLSVAACTFVWSDQSLRYPTSISVWQRVHLSEQISPGDTLLLSQCGSVYTCLSRSVPEIPYFYLSVAGCTLVWADRSPRYPSILPGPKASKQPSKIWHPQLS